VEIAVTSRLGPKVASAVATLVIACGGTPANDGESARRQFEVAVAHELAGDQFAARKAYEESFVASPQSEYGAASLDALNDSTGLWVAASGVLAAAAVPAFLKYLRRAKTAEAVMNLRILFDSAITYWNLHGRFPATAPLTPVGRTACFEGKSVKMTANPADWAHPTWVELNFAIPDAHSYQYEFISEGGQFTARAFGDLDCDGVLSTFERVGSVDPTGTFVSGGAGLFAKDELE
jgi:type IV pilus assembly protein PilA